MQRDLYIPRSSVAIIGAGLVGGAILNEFILAWACKNRDIDTIYFTARSKSKLVRQLQKTKELINQEDINVEQENLLRLSFNNGTNHLLIEGEILDMIPKGLNYFNIDDEMFRRSSSLYSYLAKRRPKTLIIGANLSAIVAYTKELEKIQNLTLAWILTTLKYAADDCDIETVAIMGTTALGGQGINLVWTHQSSQEMDINLVNKILAAYGILGILDRISQDTDSKSRWILLTPGSLLGYDYIDYGQVKYFSIPEGLPKEVEKIVISSDLSLPLYNPLEIDLKSLSEEEIPWTNRRMKDAFLTGAKIKCGESGEYSPIQFACISHAFQMGFNTDGYIARILLDELKGKTTGYNQIPLGSGKVIEPTAQGQNERYLALKRLAELEIDGRSPPVYPALGSPRGQKEMVLADLIYRLLVDSFDKPTLQQIANYDPRYLANDLWNYLQNHPRLFAEIVSVIPIISPGGRIYTGPHIMYLNKGVSRTSDLAELTNEKNFQDFAALGAVDLRPIKDQVVRKLRVYETGIVVAIERAQLILNMYTNFSSKVIDRFGSSIDPRIRYWKMLTSESELHTEFDPVCFVLQFIGGERPYIWDAEKWKKYCSKGSSTNKLTT